MDMEIYNPDETFDFSRITLANPQPAQSGSFFTKLSLDSNKPLYIQFPKCSTKQNIVEALRGKYCDLMYERTDEDKLMNSTLMNWIETFEHACQDKINDKKSLWFQTELSRDDIETMMSPMTRLYKSGKYVLIRAYLNSSKHPGKDKCISYDENEKPVDLESINSDKFIIPLILVDGIKFTSRSFEIELKLVQIMVIDPPPPIKEVIPLCLIKNKSVNSNPNSTGSIEPPLTALPALPALAPLTATVAEEIQIMPTATEVEDLEKINDKPANKVFNSDGIEEINVDFNDIKESITLKKPNDVYYEIYKAAREKAKHMRKVAVEAYLEAKEIKTKYMLSDIEDSEDDDDDNNL